jgi:ribosomal protein S18 acetylase RimI-like enzyme
LTVRRMVAEERSRVVVTLARAFQDDPVFTFLIPDPISQARAALTFMSAPVIDAEQYREVWTASVGDQVVGAAVWLPPGAYPRGTRRETVSVLREIRSVHRIGSRLGASLRLYGQMDRIHKRLAVPHWYLVLLACDPAWQRQGHGSALLAPVLQRADEEGVPAYLETQKEENLPWYRRHGFEVMDEINARGFPRMWAMRRDPREPDSASQVA